MTEVMRRALEALRADPTGATEEIGAGDTPKGIWIRYPDRRRDGRRHDKFHVARRTLEALERRCLVLRSVRGGMVRGRPVVRWRAVPFCGCGDDRGCYPLSVAGVCTRCRGLRTEGQAGAVPDDER